MKSIKANLTSDCVVRDLPPARFTDQALPTQGGEYVAWIPEYQAGHTDSSPDGWHQVPCVEVRNGIPGAGYTKGINHTMHMCSFAQANALAWCYAAEQEAITNKAVEVRVVAYRVNYQINCYRALEVEPVAGLSTESDTKR